MSQEETSGPEGGWEGEQKCGCGVLALASGPGTHMGASSALPMTLTTEAPNVHFYAKTAKDEEYKF